MVLSRRSSRLRQVPAPQSARLCALSLLLGAWLVSGCQDRQSTQPPDVITKIQILYHGSSPLVLLAGQSYAFWVVAFDGAGSVVLNPPAPAWTSSNPSVAAVDDSGNVRTLAGGTATLRAAVNASGTVVADSVSFVVAVLTGARAR
jgi:hypothetical protein